jgi:threonine dehydrogenase-like Zn-dependent dehydrogenase
LAWTETAPVLKTGGRITVPREAIRACRKGGAVLVIGVYGGFFDKFPMGTVMSKALAIRCGQQHGRRRAERLFGYIRDGKLDPSWLPTHHHPLERGQEGHMVPKAKTQNSMRLVFEPEPSAYAAEPSAGSEISERLPCHEAAARAHC